MHPERRTSSPLVRRLAIPVVGIVAAVLVLKLLLGIVATAFASVISLVLVAAVVVAAVWAVRRL